MTVTPATEPSPSAAGLLDAVVAQQRIVAAAQARLASLAVQFADARMADDEQELGPQADHSPGAARPGEFVADELSLALRAPVWEMQRLLARCRRLRVGLPSVWAAAMSGRLDEPRLIRIDRAARLIIDPYTLTMLDETVVPIAADKTPKQLETWLQRFLAEHEPDAFGHRHEITKREGLPATIGVIVSIESLVGASETPGQLADRTGCLPAKTVRELAARPGTLFYRLLTDRHGHLLDVTRMGRFATGELALAVRLRAGTCRFPTCTVPADRCDLDHHEPVPRGPTAADNLDPASRRHHRAKTHAGYCSWRLGHERFWTTPTGHTYRCLDEPFAN